MRPEALQVEIRPRTAGQVIALTTRMLQLRARPLLAAWATCSIAISAVALLLLVWLQWNPWLVWLLVLTFGSMFAPPVVATIGMLVFSPKVKLRDVVSMSLRRALPYWLAFIPMRLATLVAAAGLLVPGYYVWRQAWFLGPVVLLEGTGSLMIEIMRVTPGLRGILLDTASAVARARDKATFPAKEPSASVWPTSAIFWSGWALSQSARSPSEAKGPSPSFVVPLAKIRSPSTTLPDATS